MAAYNALVEMVWKRTRRASFPVRVIRGEYRDRCEATFLSTRRTTEFQTDGNRPQSVVLVRASTLTDSTLETRLKRRSSKGAVKSDL